MPAFLSLQYSVNYDIVSWTCGPINSGSMRLRRDKQLLNNYGTLAKTTMKLLTGVAPAGRSQSFGSLKRVDEVNNYLTTI